MKRILIGCATLCAVASLGAQTGAIESLVERSPFLPPGYRSPAPVREAETKAPVSAAATRYELIGVVGKDGEITVSLRRRGEPRGTWLSPGDTVEDIKFIQFNVMKREAVVENGGRRETIPLKAPSVTGEIPAPPPPQNSAGPNFPPKPETANNSQNKPKESVKIPVRRRVIVPQK